VKTKSASEQLMVIVKANPKQGSYTAESDFPTCGLNARSQRLNTSSCCQVHTFSHATCNTSCWAWL